MELGRKPQNDEKEPSSSSHVLFSAVAWNYYSMMLDHNSFFMANVAAVVCVIQSHTLLHARPDDKFQYGACTAGAILQAMGRTRVEQVHLFGRLEM